MEDASPDDLASLRRERDLYLRLLELSRATLIAPFLERTLALLVEVTGADHGYFELRDSIDPAACWSAAHQLSETGVTEIRSSISHGIIARTLAMGETVVTASAKLDDRFSTLPSVQGSSIEAVLCIPIRREVPVRSSTSQAGVTAVRSSDHDRACAETASLHVEPVAGRLLAANRTNADDATASIRRTSGSTASSGALPSWRTCSATSQWWRARIAPCRITGDTGTGKTQLARLIHINGTRAGRLFTEPNMKARCTRRPPRRALRPREGRVHGRRPRQARPPRRDRRRDAVPRRHRGCVDRRCGRSCCSFSSRASTVRWARVGRSGAPTCGWSGRRSISIAPSPTAASVTISSIA
jgi:hypothetical protein